MIVIIVAHIERQVSIDPLDGARTVQTTCAACVDTVIQHILGEVLVRYLLARRCLFGDILREGYRWVFA